MRYVHLLVISLTLSAGSTIMTQDKGEATSHLELGKRYRLERNFEMAAKEFKRAIELDGASADAYYRLGNSLYNLGDVNGAITSFQNAITINPNFYKAYIMKWDAEFRLANWSDEKRAEIKKAVDNLLAEREKAGKLDKDFIQFIQWAYHQIHTKDSIEEIFDFKKYEKYIVNDDEENSAVSDAFWKARGAGEKIIEEFEKFVEKYPSDRKFTQWAYSWMLNSYKEGKTEHLEKLKKYCVKWIEDMPDFPAANLAVSKIYADKGLELDKAVECAKKAVELLKQPANKAEFFKPENDNEVQNYPKVLASYIANLGWVLFKTGKIAEAKKTLEDALQYSTEVASTYYYLGQVQEREERETNEEHYEYAIKSYIQALSLANLPDAEKALNIDINHHTNRRDFLADNGFNVTTFTDVTKDAGLVDAKGEVLKAGSVAFGDYDGDGLDDLLFSGGLLYKNMGDGKFTNVTDKAGLKGGGEGGVWADYDNDGNLDFYVMENNMKAPSYLWHNNGNGTFTDAATKAGVQNYSTGITAAWGDYDVDGFVDLYVANYERHGLPRRIGEPDKLYHNNGNGAFTEVSKETGATAPLPRCGRGVAWCDFDNNGTLDLYVGNYRLDPNFLFLNDGKGHFTNVATQRGVEGKEDFENYAEDEGESYFGHTIGTAWGDYDNDGLFDLFVGNLAHPRAITYSDKSMLYHNDGAPNWKFRDVRKDSGIKYEETHSQPAWGDFDNDGYLDLYITSIYEKKYAFLYKNKGDGTFTDVTWLAGVRAENGWSCAWSDFDNDGDLDLVVASGSGIHLYRNDGNKNSWLNVRLTGKHCNRSAIGAQIIARWNNQIQIRQVEGGAGVTSQNSMTAHFGFGDYSSIIDLEIKWPCGKVQKLSDVGLNKILSIVEN